MYCEPQGWVRTAQLAGCTGETPAPQKRARLPGRSRPINGLPVNFHDRPGRPGLVVGLHPARVERVGEVLGGI